MLNRFRTGQGRSTTILPPKMVTHGVDSAAKDYVRPTLQCGVPFKIR